MPRRTASWLLFLPLLLLHLQLSFPSEAWLPGECSPRPLFPSGGTSVVCSDQSLAPGAGEHGVQRSECMQRPGGDLGLCGGHPGSQTRAGCRCPPPPDCRGGLGGGRFCGAGRPELRCLPHRSMRMWHCGSARRPGRLAWLCRSLACGWATISASLGLGCSAYGRGGTWVLSAKP